jgi:hypothetical protein
MRATRAAAAVLAAAIALPVAGCGKDKPKIPRSDARDLVILLKAVQRQDAKKACNTVDRTIAALQRRVEELPTNTDSDIVGSLRDGVTNLRNLVATDCATVKPKKKPETTTTETTTEPSTTTTQPSTTTTTPTTTTQTQTTPSTQSTPSTPSTPSNPSGGAGAGGAKKAAKGKGGK